MTDDDTREKLEADIEDYISMTPISDYSLLTIDYGTAKSWLDRQDAITRRSIINGGWGDMTFFGMGFRECGEKLRRAKHELLPEWCKPPQEAVCRKCGYIATVGEAMVCDSCPRCGYSGKLRGTKVDIAILDELHHGQE